MVRSVTLSTRREATGVAGTSPSISGGSSSSNGRSKRSDISEIDQFFLTVADSFDVDSPAGLVVGFDDHCVQPRVALSRFKSCRHAGQKSSECRLDLDADNRVV